MIYFPKPEPSRVMALLAIYFDWKAGNKRRPAYAVMHRETGAIKTRSCGKRDARKDMDGDHIIVKMSVVG
jgi:hypothetical protein